MPSSQELTSCATGESQGGEVFTGSRELSLHVTVVFHCIHYLPQ